MLLLKHGRSKEAIMPKLLSWVDLLLKVSRERGGLQVLEVMIVYLYSTRDDMDTEGVTKLAERLGPETSEVVMTVAERLIQQGMQAGEAKGKAEGKTEGRVATLEKLLSLKFGSLSDSTRQRLAQASEAELEHWTERILSAATLTAVFDA